MRIRLFCGTSMLLYCLLISTGAQAQLRKIYLQPKTIARENQTKFIDSIRFIPLEIKEEIKISANYSINVTPKYFLLGDYSNKLLLVYSKDGKFVKDIHYKKLGENFYPNYNETTNKIIFWGNNKNYALTPNDLVKIKLDWNNPHNKKYFRKYTIDLNDTTFSIRKDVPEEKDIVQSYNLFKDYYMQSEISTSSLYKDSLDYELKLYKNNQLVKSMFPYNRITEPRFLYAREQVSFTKTDTDKTLIITRPFSDTIYKMTGESIFPVYQLVLPLENSLPASFYTNSFKNRTERDNFYRNNGWMLHQVYAFYEMPRFIYFMVGYLSNFDSYIYNKQTNVVYKTKNIRADSSQFNLPLFSNYGTNRKGDKFYKPQTAADLLTFFKENKNVTVPKELQEFIKSKPPGNTPVIVEFKFKN